MTQERKSFQAVESKATQTPLPGLEEMSVISLPDFLQKEKNLSRWIAIPSEDRIFLYQPGGTKIYVKLLKGPDYLNSSYVSTELKQFEGQMVGFLESKAEYDLINTVKIRKNKIIVFCKKSILVWDKKTLEQSSESYVFERRKESKIVKQIAFTVSDDDSHVAWMQREDDSKSSQNSLMTIDLEHADFAPLPLAREIKISRNDMNNSRSSVSLVRNLVFTSHTRDYEIPIIGKFKFRFNLNLGKAEYKEIKKFNHKVFSDFFERNCHWDRIKCICPSANTSSVIIAQQKGHDSGKIFKALNFYEFDFENKPKLLMQFNDRELCNFCFEIVPLSQGIFLGLTKVEGFDYNFLINIDEKLFTKIPKSFHFSTENLACELRQDGIHLYKVLQPHLDHRKKLTAELNNELNKLEKLAPMNKNLIGIISSYFFSFTQKPLFTDRLTPKASEKLFKIYHNLEKEIRSKNNPEYKLQKDIMLEIDSMIQNDVSLSGKEIKKVISETYPLLVKSGFLKDFLGVLVDDLKPGELSKAAGKGDFKS